MSESPESPEPEFQGFPRITRYNRAVVVSEKLDGTNAQIVVGDDGSIRAGSRNRWITPERDNYGFARWVHDNRDELIKLGPGSHFGEWWGSGIQRRYGLYEKRFSLFNAQRWNDENTARPACCSVVPVLWSGPICDLDARAILADLAKNGSRAAPGFMQPEGIVIFHTAGRHLFKMTLDNDDASKGVIAA